MPEARYLMAATLLMLLTVVPLVASPAGTAVAASPLTGGDRAAWSGPTGGPTADTRGVAQSNENERKDREDRRGRNQNDSDDNDDGEDWSPPPPRHDTSPPPASANDARRCLSAGESVTLSGPNGTVAARVFQDGVKVGVEWVDVGTVPQPTGGLLGDLAFRLTAGPCKEDAWSTFPNEVNISVRYGDGLVAGRNESAFAIAYYDGRAWAPVEKGAADPPNNYVSASVNMAGIYGLVQK